SPDADQLTGDIPPTMPTCRHTATDTSPVCAPGFVTAGTSWTVHANAAARLTLPASVAGTVTEYGPAVVGVPEIRPSELIARPAGSPEADHVRGAFPPMALSCRLAATVTSPDWAAGGVTVGPWPVGLELKTGSVETLLTSVVVTYEQPEAGQL